MRAARPVLAACLGAIAVASPAVASPFYVTDADAADGWELKVAAEFVSLADEDVREAPVFDITAPLRPGLETSVTFGWGRIEESGVSSEGFLDFGFAMKAELMRQERGAWASIAIEPAVSAPTGTNGLSAAAWAAEFPVIASRQIGPVALGGVVNFVHVFDGDAQDELGLGVLATLSLAETFSVGIEAGRDAAVEDLGEAAITYGVGASWEFAPGYALEARVGRVRENGEDGNEVLVLLERAF